MKIAFSTFCCPTWPIKEVVGAARHYGYHGIEFRIDASQGHNLEVWSTREDRNDLRNMLHDRGIEVPCIGTSLQFLNEEAVEQLKPRLELAHHLDAGALRVLCGRPMDETEPMEDLIRRCAYNLRLGCDYAQDTNIELWLETHDTVCRGAEAAAVVRQVDHYLCGLCYDILNPARKGESLDATLAVIDGLVRHVHFHDGRLNPDQIEISRLGNGDLLIDETFQALIRMGFDGHLTGEWFYNEYGDDPDDALDVFQQEVVELGRRFGLTLGA